MALCGRKSISCTYPSLVALGNPETHCLERVDGYFNCLRCAKRLKKDQDMKVELLSSLHLFCRFLTVVPLKAHTKNCRSRSSSNDCEPSASSAAPQIITSARGEEEEEEEEAKPDDGINDGFDPITASLALGPPSHGDTSTEQEQISTAGTTNDPRPSPQAPGDPVGFLQPLQPVQATTYRFRSQHVSEGSGVPHNPQEDQPMWITQAQGPPLHESQSRPEDKRACHRTTAQVPCAPIEARSQEPAATTGGEQEPLYFSQFTRPNKWEQMVGVDEFSVIDDPLLRKTTYIVNTEHQALICMDCKHAVSIKSAVHHSRQRHSTRDLPKDLDKEILSKYPLLTSDSIKPDTTCSPVFGLAIHLNDFVVCTLCQRGYADVSSLRSHSFSGPWRQTRLLSISRADLFCRKQNLLFSDPYPSFLCAAVQ
jgi:hypothetical protein